MPVKASGRPTPELDSIPKDVKPSTTDLYSLGSTALKWLAIFVLTVYAATIIVNNTVRLDAISGELVINATTNVNGSLIVRDNITAVGNISADYYHGDGSLLSGVAATLRNYFNQQLNTTEKPTWVNVTATESIIAAYFWGDGSHLTGISGDNVTWNESRAKKIFPAHTDVTLNISYHEQNVKHGNTSAEIKAEIDAYPTGNTTAQIQKVAGNTSAEIKAVHDLYPTGNTTAEIQKVAGNTTAELTAFLSTNRTSHVKFLKNTTVENILFETDPLKHYIIDNGTCISIFGNTSEMHVC